MTEGVNCCYCAKGTRVLSSWISDLCKDFLWLLERERRRQTTKLFFFVSPMLTWNGRGSVKNLLIWWYRKGPKHTCNRTGAFSILSCGLPVFPPLVQC